jgi:alpha 1,2-mannosyltransferase
MKNGTMDRKANAVIVMLGACFFCFTSIFAYFIHARAARNGDLGGVVKSMSQLEAKFNRNFGYPYVFLNEEPFSTEFRRSVKELTQNNIEFGLIPRNHWFQPDSIDEAKAAASRQNMVDNGVIYGGAYLGFDFTSIWECRLIGAHRQRPVPQHVPLQFGLLLPAPAARQVPLLLACRVRFAPPSPLHDLNLLRRPDVNFFCNLPYDPFLFMQDNNLKYGFTISLPEYPATIPTLWDAVREFIKEHPEYVVEGNAMGFLSDNGGKEYNNCHCESASRLFPSQAIRGVIFFVPPLSRWVPRRGEILFILFPFLPEEGRTR